ncbi:hypothetical protein TNCV_2357671 [Trichonephila clavipes]|nr:hypothetical protein TNCV_2357671 [Trichonephila clavipes]
MLEHPPCSLDLSPGDSQVFRPLKTVLRFYLDDEVKDDGQINSVVGSDDVQGIVGFPQSQELTIDGLTEMHDQKQDIEEHEF